VSYPDISIGPNWPIPGRRVPHILGPGGTICYYAAGSVVLDRYNPDGTVLQCLDRAETVLREALQGKLDRDFEAEFPVYWGGTWMLYDLPRKFAGTAKIQFISLDGHSSKMPVLHGKKSWLLARHSGPPMSSPEPVTVLSVEDTLSINPRGTWPPNKLSELLEWLSFVDPRLGPEIDKALVSSEGALTTIGLQAPNGLFVVRIEVPDRFRTTEFLKTRRKVLPKVMRKHAREVKVERITANAADIDYIYGRNLGSLSGLSGKRILLIGCGTIGSFLAQQLAQSGAGINGRFLVVDNDALKPANLGRHLLGVPYLHRNKAEACAEFLNSQLPGAKIEGSDCASAPGR
ncbi:MAG: ThiF family adenylyltransferase, partial [Fimbriimonadaceae bacterium]